ncbi:peroxisomal short-chain alcohol dehydrogenase [Fusarium beomiforme]|uniref:Peroxisomal short-chain alcohol dehydrogenase n=1 Tax=Fusarium beomiforme TaxID=44412 RepID=A0A9P5AG45_9HYPO|nr:peroxisomal short-chain alcohol dehydrogenase [Fusarium beomiforme]
MSADANTPTFLYKPVPLSKTFHAKAYDAISPHQPLLSQAVKTVRVTGGSTGIGYAIAANFGLAGADKVIITASFAAKVMATRIFERIVCEISDPKSIDKMYDRLAEDGVHVDVLVLNAALNVAGTLSEQGWEKTWDQIIVNARAIHHLCDRLHQQDARGRKYYIVNVSTGAIHDFGSPKNLSSYSLTKASGTLLLQKLADEVDPSQTQIISFHPGAVLTDQVREKGMTENTINWDDVSLPGAFAVWCASEEAAFLHGRFVWSAWDVDEMKGGSIRKRLDKDGQFLRIGVHGL